MYAHSLKNAVTSVWQFSSNSLFKKKHNTFSSFLCNHRQSFNTISHFQKMSIHKNKYRIQITLLERTSWHTFYITQALYESAVLPAGHIYLHLHHKYIHTKMQLLMEITKKSTCITWLLILRMKNNWPTLQHRSQFQVRQIIS